MTGDRHLVATILLDECASDVPGERKLYSSTVSINGRVIRFAPSQGIGTQMCLVVYAVLEERERAARSALPDVADGNAEHP